jgi:hypothetical protein
VVEAHRDDWLFPNATWTGESGSFRFELFGPAAPVEIRLDHGGARYSVANVEPGTLDVELVVPEATRVRLRAVDAVDRAPIPDVAFEVASALPVDTWFSGRDPSDDPAEGWQTVWLRVGAYDAVAATVDESPYAALPFVLHVPPAEGPVDREVALDRGVLVSLLLDPEDPPQPIFLVAEALADRAVPTEHPGGYWSLDGEGLVHRWTYHDTLYCPTLHGVAPGRYRVLSPSGTLRFAPAVIEVPPGVDELEVALAWERIDSE